MKKVLVITNRYYQRAGGIERHVHAVNTSLSQAGCNILHVCFDPNIEKEEKINANYTIKVFKTLFIFSGLYPIITVRAAMKMRKVMLDFKPDIIHTHNRYMLSTIVSQVLALFRNIPVVHTEHASSANTFSNPILNIISQILDKTIIAFLLHKCQIVTAVSDSAAHYLARNFKLRNPLVIKNFIDTDEIDAIIKSLPQNKKQGPKTRCIYIGRLVETKGYQQLVKFLDKNEKDITDFTFAIIGGGPGEKLVKTAADVHKNVTYLGELSHEETIKQFYQSDIYLNLSSLEGLSTTIMEAMYLRKVIVATHIAPNIELLGNYPLAVIIKENPAELLEVLVRAQETVNSSAALLSKVPTLEEATEGYLKAYSVAFPHEK